jgi:hypothetical protein
MSILHKRERFNRNCVASSRGAYVMHAHKKKLEENHTQSASFFAAVKKSTPVYYVKCFGSLIQVTPERAAMYPKDMVVIK